MPGSHQFYKGTIGYVLNSECSEGCIDFTIMFFFSHSMNIFLNSKIAPIFMHDTSKDRCVVPDCTLIEAFFLNFDYFLHYTPKNFLKFSSET